jgi:hypothetical protein
MRQIIIDIDCDEKYCGSCSGEKATDPKWASTFRIVSGCKYLGEFAYDPVCEIHNDRLDYTDGKILRCNKCLQADKDLKREQREEALRGLKYEQKAFVIPNILFRTYEEVVKEFDDMLVAKFGQIPDCDLCYSCVYDNPIPGFNTMFLPPCNRCIMDNDGYPEYKDKRKEEPVVQTVKEFQNELLQGQEPLGDEFAKVLHDNLDDLYVVEVPEPKKQYPAVLHASFDYSFKPEGDK